MDSSAAWRRRSQRLLKAGRWLVVATFLGLVVVVPVGVGSVEYTARSQFCNSCHIMEPYYESWKHSSHHDVDCIECHYEPGVLETVEGKFKALSQVAKYITRTQGTKPWAEVSDQSCMRSGCHSVRLLEGPIQFGRVKFDHRHHLLESRRGRRLRCTSCHSQIVQGEHVSVTSSVCFMCHFMPGADGKAPANTSDCLLCHGPPKEVLDVAGVPFDHEEFTSRGVRCQECHQPVIEGNGAVRKERCSSCHGEVGHIERIGEVAFLHEKHVTEHKVECFECHDEIHHGLLPLERPEVASNEKGCGACHHQSHDANELIYAGKGAVGVEDTPSRMYVTRVVCDACHTGRSGYLDGDGGMPASDDTAAAPGGQAGGAPAAQGVSPHGVPAQGASMHGAPVHGAPGTGGPLVARAGEVDCLHCHGTGFQGMVERWKGSVDRDLEHLQPLLAGLADAARSDAEVGRLYQEAWTNVELVQRDGSHGVHNIGYVLAALRAAGDRVDQAYARVKPDEPVQANADLPLWSKDGCSECHLGQERTPAIEVHSRPFSHEKHLLVAKLDCSDCHDTKKHGMPAFPRTRCASCHHDESDRFPDLDPSDCSACHVTQTGFLTGDVQGYDEVLGGMEDKDCVICHGEPPDITRPSPGMCALCHDKEYGDKIADWQGQTRTLESSLEEALRAAETGSADAAAIQAGKEALATVQADGSGGVHNFPLTESILKGAIEGLGGH